MLRNIYDPDDITIYPISYNISNWNIINKTPKMQLQRNGTYIDTDAGRTYLINLTIRNAKSILFLLLFNIFSKYNINKYNNLLSSLSCKL